MDDLNLHLVDPSLPETAAFKPVMEQFGLMQHVAESGWLDVLTELTVYLPALSDHGLVTATIHFLYETLVHTIRHV